jgi:hypothetical protein
MQSSFAASIYIILVYWFGKVSAQQKLPVKFTFITNQYGVTIITVVAFQQPILWFC